MEIIIPKGAVPGEPVDLLIPDGRCLRIIVPLGPGMKLKVALPPKAEPVYAPPQQAFAPGCGAVMSICAAPRLPNTSVTLLP